MTQKEQARLQVLNSLLAEHVTLDQAATLMGVTPRHTRRILAAYREKGAAAVAHGHRGRRPANATIRSSDRRRGPSGSHPLRRNQPHPSQRVAKRARGHRHRQDHPAAHPGQRWSEQSTTKASAQAPGAPPAHASEGMLIQMDGSHHSWLGGQAPPFTLLIAVDNATGTVVDALFSEREDAHSYFLLMQGLLRRRGIPVALYRQCPLGLCPDNTSRHEHTHPDTATPVSRLCTGRARA